MPKKTTTAVNGKHRNHRRKGYESEEAFIARASATFLKTPLTANQVRFLRALRDWRGATPMTRGDLLFHFYGRRDNSLYSKKWVADLWALKDRKYLKVEESRRYTDAIRNQHVQTITILGLGVLEKAEAAWAESKQPAPPE